MLAALAFLFWPPTLQADGPRLELDSEVVWEEADPRFGGYSGLALAARRADASSPSPTRGPGRSGEIERSDGRLDAVRLTGIGDLHEISGAAARRRRLRRRGARGRRPGPRLRLLRGLPPRPPLRRHRRAGGGRALAPATSAGCSSTPASRRWRSTPAAPSTPSPSAPAPGSARSRSTACATASGTGRSASAATAPSSSSTPTSAPTASSTCSSATSAGSSGFATRVRRFTLGPDGFGDEVTLLETPFGELDNMEGISIWRDDGGPHPRRR